MIGRSIIHYILFLAGFDEPKTQTTEAERELLCSFLLGKKHVVEIGVFEGYTTRILAEQSDVDAMIYGIDPFFPGNLGVCWSEQIARKYNDQYLMNGKLNFIPKLSTEVGSDIPNSVDFVFIDGDHTLAGITADWGYWTNRLISGGIIALHDSVQSPDIHSDFTLGSIQYFESHIRHDVRFELMCQKDSLSVLRKR
jgi:predicted O-methyltransferase YrrM